jgi:H+/Cl- antiporter ClcA
MTARIAVLIWLLLGIGMALLEWPYQALSELGFRLQRWGWSLAGLESGGVGVGAEPHLGQGLLLVFGASALLFWLAWGPLAAGRGGGVAPLLALDRAAPPLPADAEALWLEKLSLRSQLVRLPLMLLTHAGGLAVGVESPSVAIGASASLAIRRRWPRFRPLAALPLPAVAVIGGAAGLGVAFRSPLLAVTYALEEVGRCSGVGLLGPTLLVSGAGALLSTTLGQPARLSGLQFGALAADLWGWAALFTLAGALLGGLLVRLAIGAAARVQRLMGRRRLLGALLLALALSVLAVLSAGLSLNDGSLSLAPALAGQSGGPPLTLLWRGLATLVSLAAGAPGGLMHDSMTLGALLTSLLPGQSDLSTAQLGQLAAVGAVALFAAAQGTPLFCAAFVFTLQGDPQLLPALLLVSAVSDALSTGLRGEGWNGRQCAALLQPLSAPPAAGDGRRDRSPAARPESPAPELPGETEPPPRG